MNKALGIALIAAGLAAAGVANAGERTVVLALNGMDCVACAYIVKQSLARLPGVGAVEVSYALKTPRVTFDDARADTAALAAATSAVGFPSRPTGEGPGS